MPILQKTRTLRAGADVIFLSGAALLFSVLCAGCHSSAVANRPPLNPQEQRGKVVYDARCVSCHDPFSEKPRQGPGLAGIFRKKYLPSGLPANDDRAREVIVSGRGNMPGFHAALDDQEIADLMAYLHTL